MSLVQEIDGVEEDSLTEGYVYLGDDVEFGAEHEDDMAGDEGRSHDTWRCDSGSCRRCAALGRRLLCS